LKIAPGERWQLEIRQAVLHAAAVLVVSTPSANNSEWVKLETELALKTGIRTIPLLVAAPPTLPALRAIQWVDFRENYDHALQELLSALPSPARRREPLPLQKPKSRGYVFLGYAEEDAGFIKSLVAFLRDRGYAYWDYRESDRNYQIELFLELAEAIKNAAATISVLSPDWKTSKWTPREFIFSEEVGTPVFLTMARPMEPTTLLAGRTFIDCHSDLRAGFSKLDDALRRKGLI
jgi:TIR domain-containing protein